MPSPVTAEMVKKRELAAFGEGGELFELGRVCDVGLGGDEDGGLGGEGGVEGFEFGGDELEVFDGVGAVVVLAGRGGVGDVDEVDDDAGALDVVEELDAEAVAEVRAFDEAGEVGDGEGLVWGNSPTWTTPRLGSRVVKA